MIAQIAPQVRAGRQKNTLNRRLRLHKSLIVSVGYYSVLRIQTILNEGFVKQALMLVTGSGGKE